ncbi:retrovirus-related pol polyprotein from transposon TNT 1-94 [Tanacetum coccineum]
MDSGCSYHMTPRTTGAEKQRAVWPKKSLGSDRLCSFRFMGSVPGGITARFKHEAFGKFKVLKQLVENQTRRTVKKPRTYNGLEFCNQKFEQLCTESGIARHLTVFGTPQQNGLAERMNITLKDKVRCLLIQFGLPKTFWAEVTSTATYLINRSPSTTIEKKTHIEMWSRHPDQEDGDDEDAGDQETDQPPDLTDYQLVWDREPRTRTKPLRFRDESNMAAYAFIDSLRKNKTWELVDYPAGQKPVSCKWLFKIDERIEGVQKPRYKARLVARGFTQKACIDYNELDEKDTFLHGNLEEVIYMRQPTGYEQGNKRKAGIGSTKSLLKNDFDMKELEEAKKILSMEIVRDRSRKILRVSQSGYGSKILNNFRIDNGKSVKKPLGVHLKLSVEDCLLGIVDFEDVSRYLANSGKNHWEAVKWILKYLRGTANVGLVYGTNHGNHVDVTGFVDSDYAKDPDKGRSITGYTFLVHGCVVSWKATLQHVVALSTTEAEYMALTEAVKEAIWLRGLLEELGVELNTVAVNCDNQGAIHLSRNHVFHERTKHINVRYHFIREVLEAKTVKVLKVGTEHNVADALTKVVPGLRNRYAVSSLMDTAYWLAESVFFIFLRLSTRTRFNRICAKDMYPFPEIEEELASLMGYPYKCFLWLPKESSQVRMVEDDEEKT